MRVYENRSYPLALPTLLDVELFLFLLALASLTRLPELTLPMLMLLSMLQDFRLSRLSKVGLFSKVDLFDFLKKPPDVAGAATAVGLLPSLMTFSLFE